MIPFKNQFIEDAAKEAFARKGKYQLKMKHPNTGEEVRMWFDTPPTKEIAAAAYESLKGTHQQNSDSITKPYKKTPEKTAMSSKEIAGEPKRGTTVPDEYKSGSLINTKNTVLAARGKISWAEAYKRDLPLLARRQTEDMILDEGTKQFEQSVDNVYGNPLVRAALGPTGNFTAPAQKMLIKGLNPIPNRDPIQAYTNLVLEVALPAIGVGVGKALKAVLSRGAKSVDEIAEALIKDGVPEAEVAKIGVEWQKPKTIGDVVDPELAAAKKGMEGRQPRTAPKATFTPKEDPNYDPGQPLDLVGMGRKPVERTPVHYTFEVNSDTLRKLVPFSDEYPTANTPKVYSGSSFRELMGYVGKRIEKNDIGTVRSREVESYFDGTSTTKGHGKTAIEIFPANGKDGRRFIVSSDDAPKLLRAIENSYAIAKGESLISTPAAVTSVPGSASKIPYIIRNTDSLPRGTGAKFLVGIQGEGSDLVATRWARSAEAKLSPTEILVDLNGNEIRRGAGKPKTIGDVVEPKVAQTPAPPKAPKLVEKPAPKVEQKQKEPWEMTREEAGSNYVRFGDLSREEQYDLAENILDGPQRDELHDLTGGYAERLVNSLEDTWIKRILKSPQSWRKEFNKGRRTSDAVVREYARLPSNTAPRITSKGGKFLDGGHRVEAAILRGDKTIEALDIPDIDWVRWHDGDDIPGLIEGERGWHKAAVSKALSEGKRVPDNVVDEFLANGGKLPEKVHPEIQAKFGGKSTISQAAELAAAKKGMEGRQPRTAPKATFTPREDPNYDPGQPLDLVGMGRKPVASTERVFHGTRSQFDEFSETAFNSRTKGPDGSRDAFFFTKSKDSADSYAYDFDTDTAGRIIEADIKYKNPLVFSEKPGGITADDIRRAKARGHDAIVTPYEVAIFDKSNIRQIKSEPGITGRQAKPSNDRQIKTDVPATEPPAPKTATEPEVSSKTVVKTGQVDAHEKPIPLPKQGSPSVKRAADRIESALNGGEYEVSIGDDMVVHRVGKTQYGISIVGFDSKALTKNNLGGFSKTGKETRSLISKNKDLSELLREQIRPENKKLWSDWESRIRQQRAKNTQSAPKATFIPREDPNYDPGQPLDLVGMGKPKTIGDVVEPKAEPKQKEPWEITARDYETRFRVAGSTVDGRRVRSKIPNLGSIDASLDEYTEASGIREIDVSDFQDSGPPQFYSASEKARTEDLARQIEDSGEISPLIVVYDSEGLYILEGGHRFDALKLLGAKSFPAKVIYDDESLYNAVTKALSEGKRVPDNVVDEFLANGGKLPEKVHPEIQAKYGAEAPLPENVVKRIVVLGDEKYTRYAKVINGEIPAGSTLFKTPEEAARYEGPSSYRKPDVKPPAQKGPKLTGSELAEAGRKARADKSLDNTRIRWREEDGTEVTGTLREHVESAVSMGRIPIAQEITDHAAVSKAQKTLDKLMGARWDRVDMDAIAEQKAIIANPPKRTRYLAAVDESGGGTVLTKAEYDYMLELTGRNKIPSKPTLKALDAISQAAEKPPVKAPAQRKPKPVANAAPKVEPKQKEPWEMTREEVQFARDNHTGDTFKMYEHQQRQYANRKTMGQNGGVDFIQGENGRKYLPGEWQYYHGKDIENALSEGKRVPDNVVDEFLQNGGKLPKSVHPEIQAKYGKTTNRNAGVAEKAVRERGKDGRDLERGQDTGGILDVKRKGVARAAGNQKETVADLSERGFLKNIEALRLPSRNADGNAKELYDAAASLQPSERRSVRLKWLETDPQFQRLSDVIDRYKLNGYSNPLSFEDVSDRMRSDRLYGEWHERFGAIEDNPGALVKVYNALVESKGLPNSWKITTPKKTKSTISQAAEGARAELADAAKGLEKARKGTKRTKQSGSAYQPLNEAEITYFKAWVKSKGLDAAESVEEFVKHMADEFGDHADNIRWAVKNYLDETKPKAAVSRGSNRADRVKQAEELGTPMPEVVSGKTLKQLEAQGKKDIADGYDAPAEMARLAKGGLAANEREIAAFVAHRSTLLDELAGLNKRLDGNLTDEIREAVNVQHDDLMERIAEFDRNLDQIKGTSGRSLGAFRIGQTVNWSSLDEIKLEAKRRTGVELSEKQIKIIEKELNAQKELVKTRDARITELEAAKADAVVREVRRVPRKASIEQIRAERKQLFQDVKDILAEAKKNQVIGSGLGVFQSVMEASPELAKKIVEILKTYVDEFKFQTAKELSDQLLKDFPELGATEDDVRRTLAGMYDEHTSRPQSDWQKTRGEARKVTNRESKIKEQEGVLRTGITVARDKRVIQKSREVERLDLLIRANERHIQERLRAREQTVVQKIGAVVNAPRALAASIDLSAPGRQGWILSITNPKSAVAAFGKQVKAMTSRAESTAQFQKLLEHPKAVDAKKAGLYLADAESPMRHTEEAFLGNIFKWKKWNPIEASERAYNAYLNSVRMDAFDKLTKNITDPADMKAIARYINVATGRGDLGHKAASAADLANIGMFSARYQASRVQYLIGQPLWSGGTAASKKLIAKEYGKFIGAMGTIMGLAKLSGGVEVSTDPYSSDFMKIKIGDTRIDLWAGMQQWAVLGSRLAKGKYSTTTGRTFDLNEDKYGAKTSGDVAMKFVRSKLNPQAGAVWTAAEKKDYLGRPASVIGVATSFLPISPKELVEGLVEDGWDRDEALGLLNFLGISVNTFDPTKPKDDKPSKN